MNVQPSVLIWTVICFCLFMLVINKLLFKPVLKVMDERRARVDGAKARAAELEAERLADEERRLNERALAEKERRQLEEKQLEELRHNAARELEEFTLGTERQKELDRQKLSELADKTDGVLAAAMDEMTAVFTEKLISGGRL